MRIIAGRFKGQTIYTPKNAATTRPTTDRAKEAIFSHLEATGVLEGARVVDIYAGTGALGFEALSRGASSVVFVEAQPHIAQLIAKTAQNLHGADVSALSVRVVRSKAEKFTERMAQRDMVQRSTRDAFDLVFFDPPYAVSTDAVNEQIRQISTVMSPEGIIMVERSIRSEDIEAPDAWQIYLKKDYGETTVFYLEQA
ncbi:16S rRNA (guanine(966)-N(2))-methyltransferase RsmD [Alloscardovia criceti]|uniref:16S rRNA (guanine(966)-N(2))-methyltransferase RsmD n=1 Tax=Alloscardovia criceti TaxID=356828 RepID=UPI0003639DAD|nr:16S rRNA (guanine(966)-N(2))-methyltransferase RsmD [Alloscardovia criceti]